jgi:hypothetical protein
MNNKCGACGNTITPGSDLSHCRDCEQSLCKDCMFQYEANWLMSKGDCPMCNLKAIDNETLLAYMLNECGISYDEARQAMRDKHNDQERQKWPLELKAYQRGYGVGQLYEMSLWRCKL